MLVRYDAQSLLGGLNTSAIIREIGPLLISFLLAGKVGAFTAAELGTMRVTEQIDALRALALEQVAFGLGAREQVAAGDGIEQHLLTIKTKQTGCRSRAPRWKPCSVSR